MSENHPITVCVCEIVADAKVVRVLATIVRTCAVDLQITAEIHERPRKAADPAITIHLPIDTFVDSDPIWRLAFRVGCFCPHARVSVLVRASAVAAQAGVDRAA